MTKKELIDAMMESLSGERNVKAISRLYVESVYEAFCAVAAAELIGGGEIGIQGMGKLKAKKISARKGRNPRTGEAIQIPAGQKVLFVPGRDFREALKADSLGASHDD